MGQIVVGSFNPLFRTYSTGYTLGTNGEAPYTSIYLSSNVVFSGFVNQYPVNTQGLIILVQDAIGGRSIDFGSTLTFVGASDINTAANSVTIIDVVKVSSVSWVATIRGKGTSSSSGNLPAGGTANTVLKKNSSTDFDVSWNTLSKSDVGLTDVDNTADVNKPVSTAQQLALDAKAPKDNPVFTGKVTIPTGTGSSAGINFGVGVAPSVPVNGDFWVGPDGFYGRIANTTMLFGARTTVATQDLQIPATDQISTLTVATGVGYSRALRSGTIKEIRASLSVASSSGTVSVDVKKNGTSMFTTALTIDVSELTSVTAAVPAVLNTAQTTLASDDLVTVDVTGAGTGAKGLIVSLIYENAANPAAGLNTQVQFNDGGYLGSHPNLTFNKSTSTLSVQDLNVVGAISYTGKFVNPMTASGDLIFGGSSGTPTRLAKGSDGQLLSLSAGIPTWVNPGMSNPMTASGDLIVGGTSGSPTRLAKGSDGQVLSLSSGTPVWSNPASPGMTNPMSTSGDLIYGGTSGAPTRLAKGTDGQVLKLAAGVPSWADAGVPFSWNAQSGTAYTLVLGDANNGVAMTSSSDNTITVPANADVAFSVGSTITITQDGSGLTSVAAASGVTINKRGGGSLSSSGQYSVIVLVKRNTNTWILTGDLA